MSHVLRVALGDRVATEKLAELRRIFGADVTVETLPSPNPSTIVERARNADAIVFEHATPQTIGEVTRALPDTPILGPIRKDVQIARQLGRNERGQRVQGTTTVSQFASYGRRNEHGELESLQDNELAGS